MTSKELVYRTLAFEDVPRVPYSIGFTVAARERFQASAGGAELLARIDNDVVHTSILRVEWGVHDENGMYTDEFGVVFDRSIDSDIGMPKPVLTPETFAAFQFPAVDAAQRFKTLAENMRRQPDKFHLMAFDFSLFERAWSLRGMENFLLDLADNTAFVEDLLDRIADFNITVMKAGFEVCPQVDGVFFGDDFGTQRGVMMGAPLWRELIKPRLARTYAAAIEAGKKVFIHSCGMVQELFDDLVEVGVNCFNPFQPEVMDVFDYHRRYHGRLAFWGGVSTQKTLPYATVQRTEDEIDRLLAMGRKGGYIIAPAHAMPGDIKPENVATMLRKILDQPSL